MASIRKEIPIDAPPDTVWDAVRDVGAIHTRLARQSCSTRGSRAIRGSSPSRAARWCVNKSSTSMNARAGCLLVVEWARDHHTRHPGVPDGVNRSRIVWIADLLPTILRLSRV